ncbi:hypothetical protein [Ethanoligenens sp.]|uniref:hypothetical protein n=1 Tax=Ethanoligenens sp. TaxID=2099655 RepID=UPI0039EA529B
MIKQTVTDSENTYDVEFTKKGIYVYRHGDSKHIILAEIGLRDAAAHLVDTFIDNEP